MVEYHSMKTLPSIWLNIYMKFVLSIWGIHVIVSHGFFDPWWMAAINASKGLMWSINRKHRDIEWDKYLVKCSNRNNELKKVITLGF